MKENAMMLRKSILTATVFFFVLGGAAVSQDLKVGYMNPQEVLNQLPERADIEQKLNELVQEKRAELSERTSNFQQAVASYQENSASMSEAQRSQREEELATQEEELREFQQSIQQEIQQRRSELMAPIYNRMDRAINAIAENMDLDFVLNEATGFGETIIYYSSEQRLNITQQVLNRMNSESN